MPPLPLALPAGSSVGREPHAGIARLINCYAENVGDKQKAQMQVWAAPGLAALATIATTGGVRAMLEVDGILYAVVGRALYTVDGGGSVTRVGGIPSDGHVGIARNQRETGVQVIVVCDGLAWVAVGGTLTTITDADLTSPIDVCVVNRSAVFATAGGRMLRSEIDDATSIDGLDVAEAESAPDGLLRVVDRGSDLIAIGQRSYEVWQDIGGDAFGFARQYTARIGAVGSRAVTKSSVITQGIVTDTVAWVATDQNGAPAGVVLLDGATVRKVSTLSEDLQIAAVADRSSIVATSWVMDGQGFISFRLPTTTLVYNTTTGQWHDRQSRDTIGNATTWRVSYCAVLGNSVLAGDHDNPKIYTMSADTYTDAGVEMVATVRCPPAHAFPGRIEMSRLHLDIVPGVGLVTGATQDVNPVVTMRYSNDGETWSSGRDRAIGAQGKRLTRVDWTRLGTFDARTFEFSCSAAVARGFMSASWEGETLPA